MDLAGSNNGDTDAPTPRGKPVMLATFVDANLMADITKESDAGDGNAINRIRSHNLSE